MKSKVYGVSITCASASIVWKAILHSQNPKPVANAGSIACLGDYRPISFRGLPGR
jgi:hypothetical protein